MDDINKLVVRATACTSKAENGASNGDTFYLNGLLPPAHFMDDTVTQTTAVTDNGVFAVFSGIDSKKRKAVKLMDDFAESIINCGKAAVDACVGQLTEELGTSDFSFAIVRLKENVGQIFYHGTSRVYIYRGQKVVHLTSKANPANNKDEGAVCFTPEFKVLESDALMLCTEGAFEMLGTQEFKQIFDNTATSKGAACSAAMSASESGCTSDATALVLRVKEEINAGKSITPEVSAHKEEEKAPVVQEEKEIAQSPVIEDPSEIIEEVTESADVQETIEDDARLSWTKRQYLGMSLPSWIVIGVLTTALGVISGLITLMFA